MTVCRQGVAPIDRSAWGPLVDDRSGHPLRVAFFGRAAAFKGIDILVDAVMALDAQVPIEVDLYVVANANDEQTALTALQTRAGGDSRLRFHAPIPSDQVRATIRKADVLAVPSRSLETGPLVAMEALAAGVPVLGSDLGGLREFITQGKTGWLLPHDDVPAWTAMLERLARGGAGLSFKPEDVSLSTTAHVASRMHALYAEALA